MIQSRTQNYVWKCGNVEINLLISVTFPKFSRQFFDYFPKLVDNLPNFVVLPNCPTHLLLSYLFFSRTPKQRKPRLSAGQDSSMQSKQDCL